MRSQALPVYWEASIGLLAVNSLLQDREGMAPMDANRVAGDIGRWKKGETHDVIPVHVGHEKIIHLGFPWTVLAHDLLSETAQPRAHITHHILGAIHDVHTRGVAIVAVPDGEIEFLVDEALDNGRLLASVPYIIGDVACCTLCIPSSMINAVVTQY